MHLAISGLGEAVEDLRAATCRFGRELFLPVGPEKYCKPFQMQNFLNGLRFVCLVCSLVCRPAEWDLWVLTIGVRPGPPLDKPLSTWTSFFILETQLETIFKDFLGAAVSFIFGLLDNKYKRRKTSETTLLVMLSGLTALVGLATTVCVGVFGVEAILAVTAATITSLFF